MTVECKEIEYCKVKVHYIADADVITEKQEEVLDGLKKSKVKAPGVRAVPKSKNVRKKKGRKGRKKGRANRTFHNTDLYERSLKKRYSAQIKKSMERELISEAYDEVLFETKMKPIGYPEISNINFGDGAFECDLLFLKKPEFELQTYKGIKVPKPHEDESATERAEKMMQMLRERHGDVVPYGDDDVVVKGDNVTIDIKGFVGDESIELLNRTGVLYTAGEHEINEFDENLYGMKPGEERSFDVVFEDVERFHEDVRGKTITFHVNLHMGTKTILCPLDDEFAIKMGYKTADEMRAEAEGSASAQLKNQYRQEVAQQVLKRLTDVHDFEVPAWLMVMESQNHVRELQLKWDDLTEEQIDSINKKSREKIKLSMILDSIRDEEPESSFSNEELILHLKKRFQEAGKNPEEELSRAAGDGRLIGLLASLRDETTTLWLVEQSEIIE